MITRDVGAVAVVINQHLERGVLRSHNQRRHHGRAPFLCTPSEGRVSNALCTFACYIKLRAAALPHILRIRAIRQLPGLGLLTMPAVTLLFCLSIFPCSGGSSSPIRFRAHHTHNASRFLHPPAPPAGYLQTLGHILAAHSPVGACLHLRERERSCRPSCMSMIALWPTDNPVGARRLVKGVLARFGRSPMRKLLPAVCKQPGDMCDRCVPTSANHGASPTTILIDTCS